MATDLRGDIFFAIKVATSTNDEERRAFEREARTLRALNHQGLPGFVEIFNKGKRQYLVMKFVAGTDLDRIRTRQRPILYPDEVIDWTGQALDTLEILHKQQPPVIHRDIKPANLRLTPDGRVVLLDLGLAKGVASQLREDQPSKSFQAYTRDYASLEQINGDGTDERSDLCSLGTTAYHLMTNMKPQNALKRASALAVGKSDPLRLACEINSQVPEAVAHVLHRAMSLNPQERPQTAAEMRALLREASLIAKRDK